MLGAEGSTGEIRAFTRQYSATKAAPAPAAGTTAALVTAPPVVGSPMALAGIAMPTRSAQDVCAAAMGAVQAIRMSAAKPRPDKRSAPRPCGKSILSPWVQLTTHAQVARRIAGGPTTGTQARSKSQPKR